MLLLTLVWYIYDAGKSCKYATPEVNCIPTNLLSKYISIYVSKYYSLKYGFDAAMFDKYHAIDKISTLNMPLKI